MDSTALNWAENIFILNWLQRHRCGRYYRQAQVTRSFNWKMKLFSIWIVSSYTVEDLHDSVCSPASSVYRKQLANNEEATSSGIYIVANKSLSPIKVGRYKLLKKTLKSGSLVIRPTTGFQKIVEERQLHGIYRKRKSSAYSFSMAIHTRWERQQASEWETSWNESMPECQKKSCRLVWAGLEPFLQFY